jgi:hypothetical protein
LFTVFCSTAGLLGKNTAKTALASSLSDLEIAGVDVRFQRSKFDRLLLCLAQIPPLTSEPQLNTDAKKAGQEAPLLDDLVQQPADVVASSAQHGMDAVTHCALEVASGRS